MTAADLSEPALGVAGTAAPPAGPRWRAVPVANLRQVGCSLADQVFSVGGMFAVNIALARVRPREDYGLFALSYSLFTFLAGLHNAAILEAYTVYGSGRYRGRFARYETFAARHNGWLLAGLTLVLVTIWQGLRWLRPAFASPALLGMALSSGVLLNAAFRRRTFYIRQRPDLAARFSTVFLLTCLVLLGLALWAGLLNGLSAFLIAAAAWSAAFLFMLPRRNENETAPLARAPDFLAEEPGYWLEHWRYSRWVFVTALVFQFTTQAYFWLVAALLSVRAVAGLRALYNLALPVDQVFAAVSLLLIPQMAGRYAAGELGQLRRLWRQCLTGYLGLSLTFALVAGVASLPLLHLVYGGKFDDLAPLLRWYVLAPVAMGAGHAANAALKAMERPQAVLAAYVGSGVVTFAAGIPLVARLGLRGAVYGILLSAAAYAALLGFLFRRTGSPAAAAAEPAP